MSLTRWEPFREMISLRDAIDRLFEESFIRPLGWMATGDGRFVPLDIYEEGNNLIVKASLPGMKPEDLNVQVENQVLTISGEIQEEKERKEQQYHLREHRYGRFERTVRLPSPVVVDKAEAVFEDGVLTLRLPKTEEAQAKKIPIKTPKLGA
ncbi:MAG: Hsp20/alpha crystallin family protein [Chloroflexi bacterium]|nr:Hsp20/alpha crystallin family protein [Chloroflexota bacterium]